MNDIAATASPPKPAEVLPAKRRSWLGKAAQRLVLLLPGIAINTNPGDRFGIKQMQLQKFDGKTWVLFGDLISE